MGLKVSKVPPLHQFDVTTAFTGQQGVGVTTRIAAAIRPVSKVEYALKRRARYGI